MLVATLLLLANSVAQNAALDVRFPDGFMFGAATSAYQAEGFWDRDGKGPSVWDTFMHEYSYLIPNNSNGDDSAESYCKYKEDIQALKDMGMQFYRFSISWPRIMPTGLSNVINQKGIRFYSELIDEVIKNGITPMVTMHHWDLPQSLQDLGGWTNEVIAEYFEDYARVLFSNYGDRVKWWITMNGPRLFWDGYEGSSAILPFAPYVNGTGIAPYLEGHTMLKAHAKVYHLYKNEFQKTQQGKISISASLTWFDPENVNSSAHIAAAERMFDFCNNWFLHPIYSKEGDYPAIMKDRIGNLSRAYGLAKSRLPAFKTEEINYIKGTADFAALNLHSTLLVNDKEDGEVPSTSHDVRASIATKLRGIPQESFETLSPRGIRNAMNMFKQKYGDWSIFITESGFADSGGVDDKIRVKYLGVLLVEILKAIQEDRINIMGYIVWSLVDVLEWSSGYTRKYGLYHVDFDNPVRTRTPKQSAILMKNINAARRIPNEYVLENMKLLNEDHYQDYILSNATTEGPRITEQQTPFYLWPFKFISNIFNNVKDAIFSFFSFSWLFGQNKKEPVSAVTLRPETMQPAIPVTQKGGPVTAGTLRPVTMLSAIPPPHNLSVAARKCPAKKPLPRLYLTPILSVVAVIHKFISSINNAGHAVLKLLRDLIWNIFHFFLK